MPTLVKGVVQISTNDGHGNYYKGTQSTGNLQLYWGSNSSTDYGLEPYAVVGGVNIPQRRHIVSAKGVITPRNSITSEQPPREFWLDKSFAASRVIGDLKTDTKTYFPPLFVDMPPDWTTDVPVPSPQVAKYIQELVLDPNWPATGAVLHMRWVVSEPKWTGVQRIVQAHAYESSVSKSPYIQIEYSPYEVQSRQIKDYSNSPALTRASMWQGYRFLTAKNITVSGIYGGATTAVNHVALFADNAGKPGAVLMSSKMNNSGYGVTRLNPIVLEAGTWYWIGQGGETSHSTMARTTAAYDNTRWLADNSYFSDFLPTSGSYYTSGLYGTPSAWTNTTISTSTVVAAMGLDLIEGDHTIDDFQPPILATAVVGG